MNIRLLIPFFDPTVKNWSLTARLMRWLVFLWLAIGLLVLFSASLHHGEIDKNDALYYFNRQVIAILVGLVGFNAIVHTPIQKLMKLAPWLLLGILGLLLLTIFSSFGKGTLGATRWIAIGPFQLQPSELIKPFLVLQGARLFGRWDKYPLKVKVTWLGIFAIVLMAILRQPNLSTTSLCAIGLWSIAFAAGLSWRYLAGTVVMGLGVAWLSTIVNPYQLTRMSSFLNPWADPRGDGLQLVQSILAIGSGGIWGKGFGMSQQKLDYLPIQDTDFIFSVFAEEFGLVGGIFILILVMSYATLGLLIAVRSNHRIHRLIAIGATIFIVLQALFNISVAAGTLPTTGLPFPMFSYGGSSILASLMQSALLVRIARESAVAKVVPLRQERNIG